MSSSIAIPRRKHAAPHHQHHQGSSAGGMSSSSSSYSASLSDACASSPSSSSSSSAAAAHYLDRRPSLLSSSISKSEHIVVNVGAPDAPRLITCVKASQGFDWNQDIFLPSYCDYDSSDLERRQDPVQDIVLTDEEAASILPQ